MEDDRGWIEVGLFGLRVKVLSIKKLWVIGEWGIDGLGICGVFVVKWWIMLNWGFCGGIGLF